MSLSEECLGKIRAERTPGEVAVSGVYWVSLGRVEISCPGIPPINSKNIEAGEASYLFMTNIPAKRLAILLGDMPIRTGELWHL